MKSSLHLLFYFVIYSKAVDVVNIHWKDGEGENTTTTTTAATTTDSVPYDDCSGLGLFSCEGEDTNECVDFDKKCDGRKDCLNGRDEEDCHSTVTRSTVAEDVTSTAVDDEYDDLYGSCAQWDMFSCDETEMVCVLFEQLCDGHNDCYNGMDEENCAGNAIVATAEDTVVVRDNSTTCEAMDLYSCLDRSNTCVKLEEICDGVDHCVNGRDETSCEDGVKKEETCSGDKFICIGNTHLCLERSVICDGSTDCPNGEDEQNCETDGEEGSGASAGGDTGYEGGDAYGGDSGGGYGGGDYDGCANETDVFLCHDDSNSCLELYQVCNGNEDCENGRDEQNCTYTTEPMSTTESNSLETTSDSDYSYGCSSGEFQCDDFICIHVNQRCDGFYDCDSGEDEQGCDNAKNCTDMEYKCLDGACIPLDQQCNGAFDCVGGDDEDNCAGAPEPPTTTTAPPPTTTQMTSTTAEPATTTTISLPTTTQSTTAGPTTTITTASTSKPTTIQDTTTDVEENTTTESQTTTTQTSTTSPEPTTTSSVVVTTESCPADQHKCRVDGSCIPQDRLCDGNLDCLDGEDETSCKYEETTTPKETTTELPTTTTKKSHCFYRGHIFEQGESFKPNNCTVVTCDEGGKVNQEVTPGCGSCGLLPSSLGITLMTLLTIFYLRNH